MLTAAGVAMVDQTLVGGTQVVSGANFKLEVDVVP